MKLKNIEDRTNCTITDRHPNPFFESVSYYYISYKGLELSMYYDPDNSLAYMNGPYYEILTDDAYRFYPNEEEELVDFLEKEFRKHDIEIQEYPERFVWEYYKR